MSTREPHQYAGRKLPPRVVEMLHRWWHRRGYAQLPEFYRDFYPFGNALSLTLQYANHTINSARSMDELAKQSFRKTVDLEKTVTELRLALAMARSGWNEDKVDRFMGMWFNRHDLPAHDCIEQDPAGAAPPAPEGPECSTPV